MKRQHTFTSSLEGCGPDALDAFETVLRLAGSLNNLPSDVLVEVFEDRVDLAADCSEIFNLAVNEMAVQRILSKTAKK